MPIPEPESLVGALGGPANVRGARSCVTRIHVELADPGLVKKELLKGYGITIVQAADDDLQLIAGAGAEAVTAAINNYLGDNS